MKKILIASTLFLLLLVKGAIYADVGAIYDDCYFDPSLCITTTWTYVESVQQIVDECGKDCEIEYLVKIYVDNSSTDTYLVQEYTYWIMPSTSGNVLQQTYSETTGTAFQISFGAEYTIGLLKVSGEFGWTWDHSITISNTYVVNPILPTDPMRMSRMVASATGSNYKIDVYEREIDGNSTTSWQLIDTSTFYFVDLNSFVVHEQVCYSTSVTTCNIWYDQNNITE